MKFLDYIRSARRGRQAHDIELEAMCDPFTADALEGLDTVDGDHQHAVEKIDARIRSRIENAESPTQQHTDVGRNTPADTHLSTRKQVFTIRWRRTAAVAAVVLFVVTAGWLSLRRMPSPTPNTPSPLAQGSPLVYDDSTRTDPLSDRGQQSATPAGELIAQHPGSDKSTPTNGQAASHPPVTGTPSKSPHANSTREQSQPEDPSATPRQDDRNREDVSTDQLPEASHEKNSADSSSTTIKPIMIVGYGKLKKSTFIGAVEPQVADHRTTSPSNTPATNSAHKHSQSSTSSVLLPDEDHDREDLFAEQAPAASEGSVLDDKPTELNSVVVTAYGVGRKSEFTGAVKPSTDKQALIGPKSSIGKGVRPHEQKIPTNSDLKGQPVLIAEAPSAPDSIRNHNTDSETDGVFLCAETMPSFEGGDYHKFRKWVEERVEHPESALHNGLQSRVVVSFVIDTLGRLTDIRILQSPGKSFSDQVVRILRKSPRWEPGRQGPDKKVKVKFTIPVDFNKP